MCDLAGFSKLMVPGRACSVTRIPFGAMSMPIPAQKLKGELNVVQVSVGVNAFGTMELEKGCEYTWCEDIHWVRVLRLSEDCYGYNVLLRLMPSSKLNRAESTSELSLVLQCTRPIEPGQELSLWFSHEVLAMMQLTFLNPANIQGGNKYVCTKCSMMYESPNPLKLHMTLNCGKLPISWLWEKVVAQVTAPKPATSTDFDFQLSLERFPEELSNAIDLSMGSASVLGQHQRTLPGGALAEVPGWSSAFKPFQRTQPSHSAACFPGWPMCPPVRNYPEMDVGAYDGEAQVETLVSGLGKSRQGHVCLYCGKCYSRKYGLKIHIRTHTGYKPLKCKYCLRPFGDPSNLNKHVRLHAAGDTPYKCELCGKVLVRRRDLERHLKSRHMSDMHPSESSCDKEDGDVLVIDEEVKEKNVSVA